MATNRSNQTVDITGTSHPVAGRQREYLIETGIEMSETLGSTLGPNGMDKLFIDSDGMVIVSNRGSTILGEMHAESTLNPAGEMFFNLAEAQQAQLGDGSTTSVVLAGELLREAGGLIDAGVHPLTIAAGYQRAATEAQTALSGVRVEVSTDDTEELQAVVRTQMRGMGSVNCSEVLPPLLVDAATELHRQGRPTTNVTIEKSHGGTLADSVLMRGQVLMEHEPDETGMPTDITDGNVLCVGRDINHPLSRQSEDPVVVSSVSELEAVQDARGGSLSELIDDLSGLNVDVVLAAGSIDESVQTAFSEADVLSVSQLTDERLTAVARSTGTEVLPRLNEATEEAVGHAGGVQRQVVDGTMAITLRDTAGTDQLSLILRGEMEQVLDEAERASKSALRVLQTVLETPYVLPGGGASEIAVARHIRDVAASIDSREQLAYNAFADAIETVPYRLAQSAGRDPTTSVVNLRAYHDGGERSIGIDAESGDLTDAAAAGILDVLSVKQQSIEAAAGIAGQLLRIDEIVAASDLDDSIYSAGLD